MSAPSALIGRAVGDVIYPRIAETYNNREPITRLVARSTSTLLIIGIINLLASLPVLLYGDLLEVEVAVLVIYALSFICGGAYSTLEAGRCLEAD